MLNTYLGRLVFEVKVEEVGEGKKVLNNRLAISIGKDKSTFVDLVAWGSTAELIGKYYKQGYEILVQAELINKKRLKDIPNSSEKVEYDTVALLVDRVIFTHGNPKDNQDGNTEFPDFLK